MSRVDTAAGEISGMGGSVLVSCTEGGGGDVCGRGSLAGVARLHRVPRTVRGLGGSRLREGEASSPASSSENAVSATERTPASTLEVPCAAAGAVDV